MTGFVMVGRAFNHGCPLLPYKCDYLSSVDNFINCDFQTVTVWLRDGGIFFIILGGYVPLASPNPYSGSEKHLVAF